MSITSGIGLVSGIDTYSLIEQLLGVEAQAKVPIFQRISGLNASKTALLDVNARLLSLGNAAKAFRSDDVFRSVLATSSNEDILGVTATTKANPGQYMFRVRQLVSTSQQMSRGFASKTENPLGLESMSFEWGQGRVSESIRLDDLNGGQGVDRGKIRIQDRAGNSAVIDLSEATTLEEVVEAINAESGIQVVANFNTDKLQLVDESGGSGTFSVSNEGGRSTATDLGIEATVVGIGLINGEPLNSLGVNSLLTDFNDGNGVLIRDNIVDFVLDVDGTTYDIDLGRVDAAIDLETRLEDLNDGDGVTINEDPESPDFTIITSTGQEIDIDLGTTFDENDEIDQEAVETVSELLARVNSQLTAELGAGQVVLSIREDGKGFEITDNMGGGGNVEVVGAGINADGTAEDLGLLGTGTALGITGSVVPNKVQTPRATTIQDLMDRVSEQTSGAVSVSIAADGEGLEFTAAAGTVTLLAGAVDGSTFAADVSTQTVRDLGFSAGDSGASVEGSRVSSGLGTVLLRTLQGGAGLGGSSLTVTDREGDSITVSNLDLFDTLEEALVVIGTALSAAGVDVTIGVNDQGNGLLVEDDSGGGGNLTISGDAAAGLGLGGLDAGVASDTIRGDNLQRQYVSLGTPLSELNYGRGVGTGRFRITDSSGDTGTIDIGSDSKTLYDVMREINARFDAVEARLNENGDGMVLVDVNSDTPTTLLKVEALSGSVARDLGIVGEADEIGGSIDGSYEKVVDFETTDTLDDVVGKINDAGLAVSASILNTGAGGTPYRLVLASEISGLAGDLVIDSGGVDLGLSTLTKAQNAKVFIGEGDNAILVESDSNTVEDVVPGVSLDLRAVSSSPVSINVTRNRTGIIEAVERFVTTFNDAIGRINEYDNYDVETEKRGPLLGDPTVSRVRSEMYRTLQQAAVGVDTQYRYLSEVGIRIGKNGEIDFKKEKFEAAYENDPAAVANLFTAFEQQGSTTETIAEGITVDRTTTTYTAQGFGEIFKKFSERMTNSIDGVMTLADRQFQTLIDSQNDRIERIDDRIEAKRTRLQRQFAAMEEALAKLQSQQSSLGAISQNIAMAGALIG
jgi:flagellar hook-associated protein 2